MIDNLTNELHIKKIATEMNIALFQVGSTAKLLDEGATVPFIARYRKELTGSLDEVQITTVRDRLKQIREMEERRDTILKSLEERGLLTDELREKIMEAETMAILEDIYLPYRPKRRTRAMIAKEKGLEPLAQIIFEQTDIDPEKEALSFIDSEKGVNTIEEALAGARDIIAEWVSEDGEAREKIREYFALSARFKAVVITGKEVEGAKYRDYFNWDEPAISAPSHRILAMRRGENEGFLRLTVTPPEEQAISILESLFIKNNMKAAEQVRISVIDSYKRLISPSMETEIRMETKKRADSEAIHVFAENLRQLLLASPLGSKTILAVDPGIRTGCKICCLDSQGKLLHHDVIYLQKSEALEQEASDKVRYIIDKYSIEVVAVGNGTAGRETETFLRSIVNIPVLMVNESGASVYSASEVAREEFPDYDVTVRGAVSIGRRLMDPLAELVKIDPKSIGVGQYQHDVDQSQLKDSLDDVVVSCVNAVGVELNTASKQILTYVSGLGPKIASNIVDYRNENGPFRSREELLKVPRLGAKVFEQAAGFLRIRDGINPLDSSAVHPESYKVVTKMAEDLNCKVIDLMREESARKKIDISHYISDTIGLPTLKDIYSELCKPGRDPRESFEIFSFSENVTKPEDLQIGMKLKGIVTNITAFGAFIDVGVHQDGLVHISQLSDKYVKDPNDVVKVNQKVNVTVVDVDLIRRRIGLSMKTNPLPKNEEIK